VIARIVGERLSKGWGQQVLIENRPGGGTNIANEMVVRSEPDGHTLLMGGSFAGDGPWPLSLAQL
jgi:tripartite-type tricarboxylate transporter receptor subunit TctC